FGRQAPEPLRVSPMVSTFQLSAHDGESRLRIRAENPRDGSDEELVTLGLDQLRDQHDEERVRFDPELRTNRGAVQAIVESAGVPTRIVDDGQLRRLDALLSKHLLKYR